MKRHHVMPFGADLGVNGTAQFRLWAPAAHSVELQLPGPDRPRRIVMEEHDGWYLACVAAMAAGAPYAFSVDGGAPVPDPASRYNPDDVHGASALVDARAFEWPDAAWRGRPWEEAVIYELHVGTYTPAGTFNAVVERLDYLVKLGITALQLMPIADFPGARNWGYDGVLLYAPDSSYGAPDDLKSLVAAAHARGLMVLLDVVYNHFGPDGNYLASYAPQFFDVTHHTPWGAAINFAGEHSRTVRDFFIHNALYWLEEYNFDGLRLDAVHAILDASTPDIVTELTAVARSRFGRERHVHIVLENERNEARYLERDPAHQARGADAQWNDDFHHALHVLVTGEGEGYYADYADRPLGHLGRTLTSGYAYQGEPSAYRQGQAHGTPSGHLPASAFVNFTQSHDQVGNRAIGERIAMLAPPAALRLGVTCLLLAPSVPMLFMGEEYAADTPFLFFCDFSTELAATVRDARRKEFSSLERFRDPAMLAAIPDPTLETTFVACKLRWEQTAEPGHREWHTLYSDLLELRRRHIVPHLGALQTQASYTVAGSGLVVDWTLGDGARLHLRANFSAVPWSMSTPAPGAALYATPGAGVDKVPGWGALWTLEGAR